MDFEPKSVVLRKSRTDPDSYPISHIATKDAAAWMRNRLDGTKHPALSTDNDNIILDTDKEKFALLYEEETPDLTVIYSNAEVKKREFIEIVKRYNKVAKARNEAPVDIQNFHSLSSTIGSYGKAIEKSREEEQKGFRSFVKRTFRKLGDRSSMFEAWLQVLPKESHYLSILCGGIQLLLGAAGRMAEIRERIYEILDEVPSTMSTIAGFQEVFSNSSELHRCSANLYIAFLDLLGSIVEHYAGHVAGRISSALFKQSLSGQDIFDKIKVIQVYRNRLNDMVHVCNLKRQQRVEQGIRDIQRHLAQSDRKDTNNTNFLMLQNEALLRLVHDQRARLEMIERRQIIDHQQADVLNGVLEMLKGTPLRLVPAEPRIQELEISEYSGSVATSRTPSPMPTPSHGEDYKELLKTLLSNLDIDPSRDIVAEDSEELLHLAFRQSLRSQGQVISLFSSERLQSWIGSVTSGSLLVNGHITDIEEQKQSALSFVCNNLAETILQSNTKKTATYVVRWFCGEHADMTDYGPQGPTDYDAHPLGMMNNMASQLITQILNNKNNPGASPPNLTNIPQPPTTQSISSLCDLFSQTLSLLPAEAIVFCIVDGISYYEDSARQTECLEAVSRLTTLASRHALIGYGHCLFKLLVTAPCRALAVDALFGEILDMDMYGDGDGDDGDGEEELTTMRLRAGLEGLWPGGGGDDDGYDDDDDAEG